MPYLKRINSLPLINHISYKYASDIGPSWSSCLMKKSSDFCTTKIVNVECEFYNEFKFKHIYSSIEKQVLTTYTNLSRFCFLGTTPVLELNVWANEKIPKLTPAPGNRTRYLKIARLTLYLTTTDTTIVRIKFVKKF